MFTAAIQLPKHDSGKIATFAERGRQWGRIIKNEHGKGNSHK